MRIIPYLISFFLLGWMLCLLDCKLQLYRQHNHLVGYTTLYSECKISAIREKNKMKNDVFYFYFLWSIIVDKIRCFNHVLLHMEIGALRAKIDIAPRALKFLRLRGNIIKISPTLVFWQEKQGKKEKQVLVIHVDSCISCQNKTTREYCNWCSEGVFRKNNKIIDAHEERL